MTKKISKTTGSTTVELLELRWETTERNVYMLLANMLKTIGLLPNFQSQPLSAVSSSCQLLVVISRSAKDTHSQPLSSPRQRSGW